jgi:hypothetical protein
VRYSHRHRRMGPAANHGPNRGPAEHSRCCCYLGIGSGFRQEILKLTGAHPTGWGPVIHRGPVGNRQLWPQAITSRTSATVEDLLLWEVEV